MKTKNANIYLKLAGLNYVVCFSSVALSFLSICYANDTYPYGEEIFTTRNSGELRTFIGYENLTYQVSTESYGYPKSLDLKGSAIYYEGSSHFRINNNMNVSFVDNKVISKANDNNYAPYGSAQSSAIAGGGAICNHSSMFTLNGNESLTFEGNTSTAIATSDTAYHNYKTYKASSYSYGGAIYSGVKADFVISGNNAVIFRGNTARAASSTNTYCDLYNEVYGGAVYNVGAFSITGNEDVVFEKNAEVNKDIYRLRSIYSDKGTLNLSSAEGKRILFKDSVYASGTVNLNQDGSGDIIFSGATTEADLREVKGGVDGTAAEIETSRTSELVGTTILFGGSLIVRDEAILKISQFAIQGDAEVAVLSGAQMILPQSDISIPTLTLGGGIITLGTQNSHDANLTTTQLTVTANSVVNGNLYLSANSEISFVDGTVTLGCSVNFGTGTHIALGSAYQDDMAANQHVLLFTDVESYTGLENVTITMNSACGYLYAEAYQTAEGTKYNIYATPEPATATLSLLALAALVARRRRK